MRSKFTKNSFFHANEFFVPLTICGVVIPLKGGVVAVGVAPKAFAPLVGASNLTNRFLYVIMFSDEARERQLYKIRILYN